MLFHDVHGSPITLSDDRTSAQRSEKHFCNGLVFTKQSIKIHQRICVELGCITTWSGGIRIGVTTIDPLTLKQSDLPKYAFPDLTSREGYWFCTLQESQLDNGTKVTLYIDNGGHLQIFINNQHKGVLLSHLPTNRQLWIVFDIYGNTSAAKFVHPDDAPTEILARGPDAVRAYEEACSSGVQSLFRTRLMLVGQEGVGKTSLRRALVGQKHQEHEKSTDGIDLSASCSFNLKDKSVWKLATQGQTTEDNQNQDALESADEEYHKAIAANIVHELLYQRRQSQENSQRKDSKSRSNSPNKLRSSSSSKIRSASPNKSRQQTSLSAKDMKERLRKTPSISSELFVPPEVLHSVPERVVELVQEMLDQRKNSRSMSARVKRQPCWKNVQLNIWDFAGQTVYYTTHQVFLSARAVYVIVFNLCHNLQENQHSADQKSMPNEEVFSTIGYMDFWMRSIHAHAAENARQSVDHSTLSPPIFIVGTHRNLLHSDPEIRQNMVDEKFRELEMYIKDKPYAKHIVTPFFAVENTEVDNESVFDLRHEIEQVSSRESYMGEQRPLKWLRFEHRVEELVNEGTHYATYDQIEDIAREEGIITECEVKTMLEFYHDLGLVVYYGGASILDNMLRNTVILDPRWLIDMFKRIITAKEVKDKSWLLLAMSWEKLEAFGILEECIIDHLWEDVLDQKPVLLNLMERFDLICKRQISPHLVDDCKTSYYVPAKLKTCEDKENFYVSNPKDVIFYLDFNGFLPDGLFYRILTRAVRWSQRSGGQEPQLFKRVARFFVDSEHDMFLEMSPHPYGRIKVAVANVTEKSDTDSNEENLEIPTPNPTACAKVRNFLDSTVSDLKAMWMRRICYRTCVECPCGRSCKLHSNPGCSLATCQHFLDLDECLTNKVVLCEHRRIKTSKFKKWFPQPPHMNVQGPILPSISLKDTHGNIEKQCPNLPGWVKGAAKLLNGSPEEQDWITLAKQLGYKPLKIEQFNDDLNPALALLTDWIVSSGNTALSVDVIITYLEQMQRDDIVEVIQSGQENNTDPAQVFISYQWDSQGEVRALRDRLERAGFTCWMDIGQMGGGDQLYNKIDSGIRQAKVILACVTPKYIVSHYCNRELNLADLITKPIIPMVFEKVAWPPPGGMSLVFSQLVYINMKGIGGHGGSGVHADLDDKYNEVIQRISQFAKPVSTPQHYSPFIMEDKKLIASSSNTSLTRLDRLSAFSQMGSQESPRAIPSLPVQSSPRPVVGSRISPAHTQPQPVVEQVHISKCGVCAIL